MAFAAAVPFTFVVRGWARAKGLIAKPRADRWHRRPTALFGGIGIFAAFLFSYVLQRPAELAGDALIVLCASAMFVLGLVDDFVTLKPYTKLVGQIAISIALTTGGMRLHFLPFEVLDQALSIFWLVGIANALNLLDNLDGLAGGVAVIAAGFLTYFCHAAGQPHAAQIAAALTGAALGFLLFNFNPASIFMGDCGSLFLGFVLGSMGMVTTAPGIRRNVVAVLAVPVFVLLIPILDTTLVTLIRSAHGRPVSQGGRDHTSHRLVALGFSERSAALLLWAGSAGAGFLALVLQQVAMPMTVFLILCTVMVLAFLGLFVGRVKVYTPVKPEQQPAPGSGRTLIPTLADFAYKRRVFEVLSDLTIIIIAYYGAFLLRFDGDLVEPHYTSFRQSLPMVLGVQMVVMLLLGLYKGVWQKTSLEDLWPLFKRVGGAWVASVVALSLAFRLGAISRAALVIDGVLLLLGIAGSRLAVRLMGGPVPVTADTQAGTKVLVYGTSEIGEIMIRLMSCHKDMRLVPVGMLDDGSEKHGRLVHGLPVIGTLENVDKDRIPQGVQEIAVALDTMDDAALTKIRARIEAMGLRMRGLSFALASNAEQAHLDSSGAVAHRGL